MEPVTVTATMTAIATLVLTKAFEKTGEKLGETILEQSGKLLSLLKHKSPSTANAIEQASQQPLDYDRVVLELEATTNKDREVAKAVEELDIAVKGDSNLSQVVQALAVALKSQPSTVQNFGKVAEVIHKAVFGNTFSNFTGGVNF